MKKLKLQLPARQRIERAEGLARRETVFPGQWRRRGRCRRVVACRRKAERDGASDGESKVGEVDPQEEAMPANDTPATAAADARRNARLVRGGCG